jgi:anti-sigma regulatory factor (Ser/Thr protein kinase)
MDEYTISSTWIVILITAHSLGQSISNNWQTISFASTLYLEPVLEVLLSPVPTQWQSEVRLGLQEALVNAAKHGNHLDPSKQVKVLYNFFGQGCCWMVLDQGLNTPPPCTPDNAQDSGSLCPEQECGRGFFILNQIFDRVQWDWQEHRLSLWKQFSSVRKPLIS